MPDAYFCNCVAEEITVSLNDGDLVATRLDPRTAQRDSGTNSLPMHAFLITESDAEQGKFSRTAANTVVIRLATLRDEPKTFEIEVHEIAHGDDLHFYVFENTLAGHDEIGCSKGISIHTHEIIKRLIQTGLKTPQIKVEDP